MNSEDELLMAKSSRTYNGLAVSRHGDRNLPL